MVVVFCGAPPPADRTAKVWTKDTELVLQNCFYSTNWTASRENFDWLTLARYHAGGLGNQDQENHTATGAELSSACFKVFGLRGQNGRTTLSCSQTSLICILIGVCAFHSICNRVLNFLTDSQTWKLKASKTVGSGTPAGLCARTPSFTQNCVAYKTNTNVVAFLDDTTIIRLDEVFRRELTGWVAWCQESGVAELWK